MGILDFIKRPRHPDHPNRKASLRGRSQVYNILDNIIGFDDDRFTAGEALGANLRAEPIRTAGRAAKAVSDDLNDLQFQGGAEARPQDVFGYAGGIMGGTALRAGKGALSYDPATARIFLGQKASNADLNALKKARELSARRRSRDEIWGETGWFKGADGEWRFEIDDSKAVLRQNASDTLNSGGADYQTNYAGGVLHQPLLGGSFRGQSFNPAYRDMIGDMDFSREGRPSGSFDTDTGRIKVSAPDAREGLPIALHELQHAVQKQEGFARGSNPSFELNELLTKRNDKLREISSKIDAKKSELGLDGYQPRHPELDPLYDEYNSLVGRAVSEDQAYQNYIRTAGEVEANNVMNRRSMTAEQRAATPPWATQDFPDEEQIVRKRIRRPMHTPRGLLD
jgi:hypothetical protein